MLIFIFIQNNVISNGAQMESIENHDARIHNQYILSIQVFGMLELCPLCVFNNVLLTKVKYTTLQQQ